jgi:tetratricopeptide (TPR) repeat protein
MISFIHDRESRSAMSRLMMGRGTWNRKLAGVIFILASLSGCQDRGDLSVLETLAAMKDPVYKNAPVSPEVQEEIGRVLRTFRKNAERTADRVEELAPLYKSLGLQYLKIDQLRQDIAEKHLEIEGPGSLDLSLSADRAISGGDRPGFLDGDSPSAVLDLSASELQLYYGFLGLEYIGRSIYSGALASFEKALALSPSNEILHYYAGVSAANLGKAMTQPEDQERQQALYAKAEAYYRRAIELDSSYADALYGLSVLLVYELNRVEEAEGPLQTLVELETRNSDALFLLANVYYRTGHLEEAVELYERIVNQSNIGRISDRASSNRDLILEELYETR